MNKKIIAGVILAAGLSSRMGDFKPLMPLKGKTLIENTVESMLSSGVNQIVVVVGYRGNEISELLYSKFSKTQLIIATNEHYSDTDMLFSIKIALRALPSCDGFFLLPGDMPTIHKSTFSSVLKAWEMSDTALAFPTLEGRKKHPPLISSRCIPSILRYNGNGGLRAVWQEFENDTVTVAVDDFGCKTDIDTMQDYNNCLKNINSSLFLNAI